MDVKPLDRPWRMRVVGRRRTWPTSLEDAQRLLKTAWALRGTAGIAPRGLYRFRTFEEADVWMKRMIAQTYARQRSTTSPASRELSTPREPAIS